MKSRHTHTLKPVRSIFATAEKNGHTVHSVEAVLFRLGFNTRGIHSPNSLRNFLGRLTKPELERVMVAVSGAVA